MALDGHQVFLKGLGCGSWVIYAKIYMRQRSLGWSHNNSIVKVLSRRQGWTGPPLSPVLAALGIQGSHVTGARAVTIGIKVLLSLPPNFSGSPTPDAHSLNQDLNAADARAPTQRPQRRADVRATAAK